MHMMGLFASGGERRAANAAWDKVALQSDLPVKWESPIGVQLFVTYELYNPWNSPGPNTGVGSRSSPGFTNEILSNW